MTAPVPGMQLVDDFEKAFQDCFSILNNPENSNAQDSDEIRTSADFALQHFKDLSVQMDAFFIQKRLLASVQKPEHFLAESIQELTNELNRKEDLLDKYHAKLESWKRMLQEVSESPSALEMASLFQDQAGRGPAHPPQGPHQGHPIHMMPDRNVPSMHSPMAMHGHPMHQHQFMGNGPPVGLHGPLGYMERSMSNLNMPSGSG